MSSYNSWLTLSLLCFLPLVSSGQVSYVNPWSFVSESTISSRQLESKQLPAHYKTVRLDIAVLKEILATAPHWQEESGHRNAMIFALPMPDGTFEEFKVMEAPVMHPDLARRYPEIKTYAGHGITDQSAYLRFDITPKGFHAIVISGNSGTSFIDPASAENPSVNIVYNKKDWQNQADWSCSTQHIDTARPEPDLNAHLRSNHCQLRTYRLALSCTGEYAKFHGGTIPSALSAMVTTLNRVNAVYERYASITMQLVANNDKLIFLDPFTDPYSNNSGSSMLSQNQTTCDNVIGSANYDLGHVFSTGGGGIAYMRNVCNPTTKAGGVTGRANPSGDPFDIDYVCHELGHQFGASHTQGNNCNRNSETAVEPGSGSTIMSYAGICTPNIQSNSDAYFHAVSLAEIKAFTTSSGSSCAQLGTNYAAPSANAGPDYSIPRSTPFVLSGAIEGSVPKEKLSWNWEQLDTELATMPPLSGNTGGPSFRSFAPASSPSRYFPELKTLRTNLPSSWEVLPEVTRILNFRLTVIDHTMSFGCASNDDIKLNVVQSAGPFVVMSPNGSEVWTSGAKHFVSWQVAGTTAAPISCTQVDILLSLDGGLSYPITLAEKTANDGIQEILVPNNASGTARVMVRGSGNVFFDISNADFTIQLNPQLFITTNVINPGCFGDNKGKATAIVTGGIGDYSYLWSNGAVTQSVEGLAPGTYSVTVSSGTTKTSATINVGQPSPLIIRIEGEDALKGNDGSVKVTVSGGSGAYTYLWSNGSKASSINGLEAGLYFVTVTDANNCSASGGISISETAKLKMEFGTLSNVSNKWQKVTLQNTYKSMVVVASIVVLDNTMPSIVTRIQNASNNSFEVKAQVAGNEAAAVNPLLIHYLVAEEGVYNKAKHGVQFEARKYISEKTSQAVKWHYEPQTYGQVYDNPVVVGQVMSYNDPYWSVFWSSSDGQRTNPATSKSISAGKHIAEDKFKTTRFPETVGFMVFESGTGSVNGKKFSCGVGPEVVRGSANNSSGSPYYPAGLNTVETVLVSSATMNGSEGAWPLLIKSRPGVKSFKIFVAEDQLKSGERSIAAERVSYIAFGGGQNDLATTSGIHIGTSPIMPYRLKAFPNPAVDYVNWELEQRQESETEFTLYDMLGRKIIHEKLPAATPGVRSGSAILSGLEPGLYMMEVKDESGRERTQLMIERRK